MIRFELHVMRMSGDQADYYVAMVGEKHTVYPHSFRKRYMAMYHIDLYNWVACNREEGEPDLMTYDEKSHPNFTQEVLESGSWQNA